MKLYLFPFEKIEDGDKVVIFGAGAIAKQYEEQFFAKGKQDSLLYFVANNYKDHGYNFKKEVVAPNTIMQDRHLVNYVVIASEFTYEDIKEQLLSMGFPENKILWAANDQLLIDDTRDWLSLKTLLAFFLMQVGKKAEDIYKVTLISSKDEVYGFECIGQDVVYKVIINSSEKPSYKGSEKVYGTSPHFLLTLLVFAKGELQDGWGLSEHFCWIPFIA
jgi:hypothetical protein